jgi:hypothetical protein
VPIRWFDIPRGARLAPEARQQELLRRVEQIQPLSDVLLTRTRSSLRRGFRTANRLVCHTRFLSFDRCGANIRVNYTTRIGFSVLPQLPGIMQVTKLFSNGLSASGTVTRKRWGSSKQPGHI